MATEYSSITTLGQLKNAQTEIRYKIEAKEKELAENYSALKAYFNPLTYIHKIITKLYALRYLGRYVATAYDFIKGLFHKSGQDEAPGTRQAVRHEGDQAPRQYAGDYAGTAGYEEKRDDTEENQTVSAE